MEMTSDLEDVVSWLNVRHIHPLAVDVMAIGIPAAHRDALVTHVVARETLLET